MATDPKSTFLDELRWRGFLEACTSDDLDSYLCDGRRTMYVGFDPTADSLHLGSLIPVMALAHVQRHGHRPLVLVGGPPGTGKSALAGAVADRLGFAVLSSDRIRKELAGWPAEASVPARDDVDSSCMMSDDFSPARTRSTSSASTPSCSRRSSPSVTSSVSWARSFVVPA